MRAEYRYFYDTWDIRAHTVEVGYSRYVGEPWLADGFVRFYTQNKALFYSDNATAETTYISRNRQLSTFNSFSLGRQGDLHLPSKCQASTKSRSTGGYEYDALQVQRFHRPAHRRRRTRTPPMCCSCYVTATF